MRLLIAMNSYAARAESNFVMLATILLFCVFYYLRSGKKFHADVTALRVLEIYRKWTVNNDIL